MCSEYHVKTTASEIERELGSNLNIRSPAAEWDKRIKFTTTAPVIRKAKDELVLDELIFPAQPFPNSRLSQLKENDQIVRIYDVPLWKQAFTQFPCVVPLTSFMEPAYWGENAGSIMEFLPKETKHFFVPGLVIKPRVPATGQFNGFTLLTHTASQQMLQYHHRLLVLLTPEKALDYLNLKQPSAEDRYQFLLDNRHISTFQVEKSRTMARGWEKRVDEHKDSLESEMQYREALEREG